MAGVAQRPKGRFGHFLALTVPSAVVFAHLPFRLRPDGNPPLQHAATRRHRTQTMQFCQIMGEFFRKVSYFAKETTNPVFMRVCGSYFVK